MSMVAASMSTTELIKKAQKAGNMEVGKKKNWRCDRVASSYNSYGSSRCYGAGGGGLRGNGAHHHLQAGQLLALPQEGPARLAHVRHHRLHAGLWTTLWPGEYGPANLRSIVTKYRTFVTAFDSPDVKKKVLEDFLNQILGDNAVRAGQRLPPLAFNEVDERANDLLDRRSDFSKK